MTFPNKLVSALLSTPSRSVDVDHARVATPSFLQSKPPHILSICNPLQLLQRLCMVLLHETGSRISVLLALSNHRGGLYSVKLCLRERDV